MSNQLDRATNLGNLVAITHLVYALHAFAVLTGIIGVATVLGSFLASLPSIAAVLINYFKRSDVKGTWLESHFRWQIRTFWFAMLWSVIGVILIYSLIGIPFGFGLLMFTTFWVTYRVARGWWMLTKARPMPVPPGE